MTAEATMAMGAAAECHMQTAVTMAAGPEGASSKLSSGAGSGVRVAKGVVKGMARGAARQ